jgi:single-strand DNA-binding protein
MAGYNRIIMVGNLTKDPELKTVGTGAVCRLSIASNRQYKNRQTGAISQEVCFVDVEVWGSQADTCKMYLQKGRPVLVEGRLKLDSWKDAEGATKSKHSIVSEKIIFLGSGDQQSVEDQSGEDTVSMNNFGNDKKMSSKQNNNSLLDEIKISKPRSNQSKSKSDSDSFSNTNTFLAESELPF